MIEVDAFSGAFAQRRGRAVEGREHEVAGVEDAGGAVVDPLGAASSEAPVEAIRIEARRRPGLQRVGATVAFAEALAEGFRAARQASDAGGEDGRAGRQPREPVADRGDAVLQPFRFASESAIGGDKPLRAVGELPGEGAEPLQFVDPGDQPEVTAALPRLRRLLPRVRRQAP